MCLSVRLSQVGIVPKRLNRGPRKQRHNDGPARTLVNYLDAKDIDEISIGSSILAVSVFVITATAGFRRAQTVRPIQIYIYCSGKHFSASFPIAASIRASLK